MLREEGVEPKTGRGSKQINQDLLAQILHNKPSAGTAPVPLPVPNPVAGPELNSNFSSPTGAPPTTPPPTGAPVTGYGLNLGHLYGGSFTNALIQKNATTAIKHLKAMDKNHPDIKHWMKVKKASSDKLKDMIKAHGGGLGDTIKKHLDGWIQKGAKWYWNHLFPPKEDAQYSKYRGGDLDNNDVTAGSFTSMFNNFSNGLIRGLTLGAVNI